MPVSERRYLKRNSTGLCNGQIFGVYAHEPLGICTFLSKPQNIWPYPPREIDIVLKKLA